MSELPDIRLSVWRSDIPISNEEAARRHATWSQEISGGFDSAVYAFHSHLVGVYPELDMLPESDGERSPWASSPEFSGVSVAIALRPARYAEVFPVILRMADRNGLVCFDAGNARVYLPSCLAGKRHDPESPAHRAEEQHSRAGRPAVTPPQGEAGSERRLGYVFLAGVALLSLAPFTYLVLPLKVTVLLMLTGFAWSVAMLFELSGI